MYDFLQMKLVSMQPFEKFKNDTFLVIMNDLVAVLSKW